jgi:hypothetical protein
MLCLVMQLTCDEFLPTHPCFILMKNIKKRTSKREGDQALSLKALKKGQPSI